MNRRLLAIVAVLLASVVLALAAAGCGDDSTDQPAQTQPAGGDATTADEVDATTSEDEGGATTDDHDGGTTTEG